MEISEMQNSMLEIAEKMNEGKDCGVTAELSPMRLAEEVGILSGEFFNQKVKPENFNEENRKKAIRDIILESLLLAELLDIDISKDLESKINELKERFKLDGN